MKVILVLILLVVIGIGVMYKFGGYSSFDPDKQGREAKAKIQPGMTVKQVVDIAGDNGQFHNISLREQKIGGQTVKTTVKGPAKELLPNDLTRRVANKELPNGFTIEYKFSEQVAFEVVFNNTGTVTEIENVRTMADLLDSRREE